MKYFRGFRVRVLGKAVRSVDDLIEPASDRVIDMQGKVEQVRGSGAPRLKEQGNIGAFLRF